MKLGNYLSRLNRRHRQPSLACHLCSLIIAKLTRSRMLVRGQFEFTDNEKHHYEINRRIIDGEVRFDPGTGSP